MQELSLQRMILTKQNAHQVKNQILRNCGGCGGFQINRKLRYLKSVRVGTYTNGRVYIEVEYKQDLYMQSYTSDMISEDTDVYVNEGRLDW